MTDTPLKRVLYTIRSGITTMRNTRFNYTNEYWYNFKSYMCGTELSFTICSNCNNYKRISNHHMCYSGKLSEQRIMCDCEIFGNNHRLIDGDIEMACAEYDLDNAFDNIDNDFTDIMSCIYDSDLKHSVVF